MSAWASDLRLALRNLGRRPGFTATAVLTLALGIGVNTLVFTWAKALVLRPLPGVAAADRIVFLSGVQGERRGLSHPVAALEAYRAAGTTAFSGLAGFELLEMALGGGERPLLVAGGVVTGNYFELLGVRTASGRLLAPADDARGAEPAAVLSARLAQRLFGSAAAAPGRTVRLQRRDVPVVGVAAPQFAGTYGGLGMEVFVTLAGWETLTGAPLGNLQVAGRLASGADRARATAEAHALAGRFAATGPDNRGWDAVVLAPSESPRGFTGGLAPLVSILLVVVALVLAIACANLAGLLLARAVDRQRETAVRLALGAHRGDLVRLQIAESLLLAAGGALLGLLPAGLLAGAVFRLLPVAGFTIHLDLGLDLPVLAATLAVTLLAAALSSLLPTLFAGRVAPALTLRAESAGAIGGRHRARLRAGLVAAQLALSLAAITAAALLVRATWQSLAADPGFRREGALVASVNLGALGYDAERGQRLLGEALERLAALPGVASASVSSFVPMGVAGGGNARRIEEIEGYVPGADERLGAVTDEIGPGFVATLGGRLAGGREFTAADRAGAPPVALVTREFERRHLPRGAVGRRLRIAGDWREIVGVVEDATYRSPGETPLPRVYLPVLQVFSGRMTFVVRAAGDPSALATAVRGELAALDADLPVTAVETLAVHTAGTAFAGRIASLLLSGLGLLALALAGIGLFGLLSYSVAARRRELGVRSALGAAQRDLLGLVIADAGRLVAAGAALGLLFAAGLGRLVAAAFPGTAAFDPLAATAALAVLAVAGGAASLAPALRAARTAPAAVLRAE